MNLDFLKEFISNILPDGKAKAIALLIFSALSSGLIFFKSRKKKWIKELIDKGVIESLQHCKLEDIQFCEKRNCKNIESCSTSQWNFPLILTMCKSEFIENSISSLNNSIIQKNRDYKYLVKIYTVLEENQTTETAEENLKEQTRLISKFLSKYRKYVNYED